MTDKADKRARTRAKVVDTAATEFRAKGVENVGVADIMRKAGLTHGGFYFHFKSKDALVAATIERMFEEVTAHIRQVAASSRHAAAFADFADSYLSLAHRDRPGQGCPVASLAADIAHRDRRARAAFEAGLDMHIRALAETLPRRNGKLRLDLAQSLLAEMVGALVMARSVRDRAAARRILDRARQSVKTRALAP